jgi:segregation and condensation protein B
MNTNQYLSALESLLFVSGEPLSIKKIAEVFGVSDDEVSRIIASLRHKYESEESGLSLVSLDGSVQLVTKKSNATLIESFAKSQMQESLSKPSLEVLSVVAYRGPISRGEIELIRGVNCSMTIRNLLLRGLIDREASFDERRGFIYTIALAFLKELGLASREELPEYATLSQDARLVISQEKELSHNMQTMVQ